MKGFLRSISRGPLARQRIVKQAISISALPIIVSGATGIGYGAAILGGLPQGNILFLGAVAYMQFSKNTGATGVQDAFDGDYSIGSTPTADSTIAGTDADIIASAALGPATGGVSPVARGTNAVQVILDNTDGSLELNLNLIIDDANISAASQPMLAEGVLHIAYIVLGDD